MLAELAIANAAYSVIKQTLSNGKEISDAGSALTKYFGASQAIEQKAKLGTVKNKRLNLKIARFGRLKLIQT